MDGILEGRVDSEVQGKGAGVQTQMQIFNLYFGIQLGVLVLRHTNNLSYTLQYTLHTRHDIELSKLTKVYFQRFNE